MTRRNSRRCSSTVVATLPAVLALLFAHASHAQVSEHPAADDKPSRQSIYIPYGHLRAVFEREGRGVFLPYEQFEALWRAAYAHTPQPVEHGPPVDAMVAETSNEASIGRDVVEVKSVIRVELLKPGWNEVPLNLRDTAITRATIEGEPARIVYDDDEGYVLLYEHDGMTCENGEPASIELELDYAKAFTKAPGQNSVSFAAPPAPISRWRVTIPEAGVKVNLHPLIAATDIPAGPNGDDETVVLAFVGAAPSVGIQWTPKAEGATGLAALASVRTEQRVWIEEGVARVRADLTYTISRAEMPRLALEVPAGHKVVNLVDANVRKWSVAPPGSPAARPDAPPEAHVQRIDVELFEPARGVQRVRVELERFAERDGDRTFAVPLVRALDVARQEGAVVARAATGLRAEVAESVGLTQLDAGELPAALRNEGWPFAYRYATVPFALIFDVKKIEPFITVDTMVAAQLSPVSLSLDTTAKYHIERAGVFQLELDVPKGYEVDQVRGQRIGDAQAVVVDTFHLEGEDDTRLVVNLARKAIGDVGLAVRLSRPLEHPELLSPTAEPVSVELAIPRIAPDLVDQERGTLVVYAPESLQVNPGRMSGLRSISVSEALARKAPAHRVRSGVLAFAYTDDPVEVTMRVRRRQPYITVRQLLTARIDPGVVKYEARFIYDVRYSGVKSLRIDVPEDLASKLRNTTSGVRHERIDPEPAAAEGFVAWQFTGESEFLGERTIHVVWERTLEKLDVGKSVEIALPRLVPIGVDRAWGQVVLAKSETLDVHASGAPTGLRPIDPQHDLMPGANVKGAARAFEFHGAWSLAVTATHYELAAVKRTSVERAVVRMVLTRSDQVSVQALYRMRSARQRLLVKLPAGVVFDTQPLCINGTPVTLERGATDEFFVPLVGQSPDTPFLLELRYTVEDPAAPLELPDFPDAPAVQKVYVAAYLPEERTLLGSRGPWTDEMQWRRDGLNWVSVPRLGEAALTAWVTEGVTLPSGPGAALQTDGRRYLYSTLRPEAPPAGNLSLVSMSQTLLSVLVFGVITAAGVLLLRASTRWRWVAAGIAGVALVVAGTMLPTFALEIMDAVLIAAVFVVLVLWVTWYFARTRPRDPFLQAIKAARREAKLAAATALVAPELLQPSSPIATPPTPGDAGAGPTRSADDDEPQEGASTDA